MTPLLLMLMLMLATTPFSPVRAEPVEARDQSAAPATRPATSSGRTEDREQTPVDAERAFAADAKAIGQWTAFRKWASPDAKMFVPEPVDAQEWLKERKDPPIAVAWQPTSAWLSCDGWMGATTGNWQRPNAVGYFSTLWSIANPDHPVWRWDLDHGDNLVSAKQAVTKPVIRSAACSRPVGSPTWPALPNPKLAGRGTMAGGSSGDGTLRYRWYVAPDGARGFSVAMWNGVAFEIVLDDKVQAPTK